MFTQSTSEATLVSPVGTLTVTAPAYEAGRSAAVGAGSTLIGRGEHCELVLAQGSVSREHAVVRYEHGGFFVEDLRSSNGTIVNGVRVTGPTILRDGDRLILGGVEVVFHGSPAAGLPSAARPAAQQHGHTRAEADGTAETVSGEPKPLRECLHDAPGFSLRSLALAVGGSVVGTVLTGAVAGESWGTLAGAAIVPIVTATFANRGPAEPRRVRAAAIAILSTAALAITVTGFDIADSLAGEAVVGDDYSTFPLPKDKRTTASTPDPTTTPTDGLESPSSSSPTSALGPRGDVDPQALDCGAARTGSSRDCPQTITITSFGTEPLHITSVEITGANPDDFLPDARCAGRSLRATESCTMTVSFRPHAVGDSAATLVIHQNMPLPDHGTPVALTGTGQIRDGGATTNRPR